MPPPAPWTTTDIPPLTGKIALVTGATSGLGYESALALAKAGATIIVGGRNEEKGKNALNKILELCPDSKVEFGKVDHCSLKDVGEFAAKIIAKYPCIDILINNAGITTPPKREVTEDGFEIVFGTNHLSHFALTAHLLPLLRKSSSPRVVNMTSLCYRKGRIDFEDLQSEKCSYGFNVYDKSKLANLLFTLELQRKSDAGGWGLTATSAHPGSSRTEIMAKGQTGLVVWISRNIFSPLFSQSAADGALPQLFAATSPEVKALDFYGPNGFFELRGTVAPAYLAPAALDEAEAVKLWDISNKLTRVTWP
jgi:NAD(P)-dependent dehydrogenase (short-subunit alcohol dehydrogenase family)